MHINLHQNYNVILWMLLWMFIGCFLWMFCGFSVDVVDVFLWMLFCCSVDFKCHLCGRTTKLDVIYVAVPFVLKLEEQ